MTEVTVMSRNSEFRELYAVDGLYMTRCSRRLVLHWGRDGDGLDWLVPDLHKHDTPWMTYAQLFDMFGDVEFPLGYVSEVSGEAFACCFNPGRRLWLAECLDRIAAAGKGV
jgi:hypothetical protein